MCLDALGEVMQASGVRYVPAQPGAGDVLDLIGDLVPHRLEFVGQGVRRGGTATMVCDQRIQRDDGRVVMEDGNHRFAGDVRWERRDVRDRGASVHAYGAARAGARGDQCAFLGFAFSRSSQNGEETRGFYRADHSGVDKVNSVDVAVRRQDNDKPLYAQSTRKQKIATGRQIGRAHV